VIGKGFSKQFNSLIKGLDKSRRALSEGINRILKRGDDSDVLEDLEELLIGADIGVDTAAEIVESIKKQGTNLDETLIKQAIEDEIVRILESTQGRSPSVEAKPHVIMVVGVNGTGKTTTIAKLAHLYMAQGYKVLLGACDTFRAAAIEQLEIWAKRVGADVVRHKPGADAASVAYDALSAARARDADIVILDTAGRLQTKKNLMQEVAKIARVAGKVVEGAPHEVLLVLDATTGQNAISQARAFSEACNVTGIVMAKFDGTAKGGIVVAIAKRFGIPIVYVGTGEGLEDLASFDARVFAQGLLH